MAARIVVVGLGPGHPGLVTAATLDAIERIPRRYLRTDRHPSATVVAGASSFDHHYETADTFDDVYRRIAEDLVAAAGAHGEVLYAVPGSPLVLERSVEHLLRIADDTAADATEEVEVEVLAALSFLDLVWVRLGVDPFEDGVRLVDAHRFAERAAGERGPLLVAHCHNRRVLSDVKLAVADDVGPGPVTVLQRLGTDDEAIFTVAWDDLDRSFDPDHLTALWVPGLAAPVAAEVQSLVGLVTTLRERCPWDREQTHHSLSRHLLEETYEVLEALDALPPGAQGGDDAYADVEEELGDLLFQVVFHSALAAEAGAFTLADVARGIHDKLVRRHPHVFGDASTDLGDITRSWEEQKRAEKGRTSAMDGIPASLPALLYAAKVLRRAESLGLVHEPLPARGARIDERLLALVAEAHEAGVDPESALRSAARRVADAARVHETGGPDATT